MNKKQIGRLALTLAVFFTMTLVGFTGCKKSEPKMEPVPDNEQGAKVTEAESEKENEKKEQESDEEKKEVKKPTVPESLGAEEGQEPILKVYSVDEGKTIEMPFEEYVTGVVGGEVMNDWPEEVLKAQAIIARTFVMQTVEEGNGSKYDEYAHVSTDIEEAQAWDQENVNDAIKNAVEATRGIVASYDGEFIYAWFHSNAGGRTALADEGLDFEEGNPPYVHSVESPDTGEIVPADERNWEASYEKASIISAANEQGVNIQDFSEITVGEKGESGRALTINLDEQPVSAPQLRIALDSMKMKSTLINDITLNGSTVTFAGAGYGHGVGVSQWGAYQMAEEGKSAEEIITYYFKDVDLSKVYE